MRTRTRQTAVIVAAALLCGPGPAVPGARAADPPPVLLRDEGTKRDWTVHLELCLRSPNQRDTSNLSRRPTTVFDLASARFLFPRIDGGPTHDAHPDRARGRLRLGTTTIDDSLDLIDANRPETRILVAECGPVRGGDLTFTVETTVTSYEVTCDELAAAAIPWPGGEWPEAIRPWLVREPFVESDDDRIRARVAEWIGPDPRGRTPYLTAKLITSKVVELYQPSGSIYRSTTRGTREGVTVAGMISGFEVVGAAAALESPRGSELNMPCLLAACWRAAGIPARLVIAADVRGTQNAHMPILHSWAEFALHDESIGRTEWIPADVVRLRKDGSRTPPITQPWRYFGSHDDLEWFAPLARSWTPPVDEEVSNLGWPGMWGWSAEPAAPPAAVEFRMTVAAAAKRAPPARKRPRGRRDDRGDASGLARRGTVIA